MVTMVMARRADLPSSLARESAGDAASYYTVSIDGTHGDDMTSGHNTSACWMTTRSNGAAASRTRRDGQYWIADMDDDNRYRRHLYIRVA